MVIFRPFGSFCPKNRGGLDYHDIGEIFVKILTKMLQ